MKAAKAKQKIQQSQPGSSAAALAHRVGPASGNVAQVPDAGTLHTSMAGPDEAGWGQGPLLVRVGPLTLWLLAHGNHWLMLDASDTQYS